MTGISRNFDEPDEVVELAGATEELITMGGLTLSRSTQSVGWRWSEHFKHLVGGELCQARHMGYVLSGILGVQLEDGTVYEIGPGELYDIPPGHDGYTVGDEPFVSIEWSGMRTWVGSRPGTVSRRRCCSPTSSTPPAWHPDSAMPPGTTCSRCTSIPATTRSPTSAGDGHHDRRRDPGDVRCDRTPCCALAIREMAQRQGFSIRAGVHVGEVEVAGEDVRGVTVHEAARIMAAAGAAEVFTSEAVRVLCRSSDLRFEDAGEHELKGVPDTWRLFRVIA